MSTPAPVVVVMGVSGCGKSTVGAALAGLLQVPFVEGDALHPPANVALMAAGTPLTDGDRHDWLLALAARLQTAAEQQHGIVVSCSALKRSYRDLLRSGAPRLRFVHLHGSPALLAARLQSRAGHYMPASLLQSQLDTLEPLASDEQPIVLDVAERPDALAVAALQQLETAAP